MDNIDIYNNSALILNKKTPSKIISWITILFIILILSFIFFSIPFYRYETYNGYIIVDEDDTYINLLVKEINFPINKYNKLYIKSNQYNYHIVEITNKYVLLSVNLENGISVNNNIVSVNIVKEKTTIFKILKERIKKGFDI